MSALAFEVKMLTQIPTPHLSHHTTLENSASLMVPKVIYPPVRFTNSIPSLGQAYQPETDQTTAYQITLA